MNKKWHILIVCILLIIAGVIMVTNKIYPVAIVNGSFVWHRTWRALERATEHALIVELTASKTKLPADNQAALILKKDALTRLIEDRIITLKGKKEFTNFESHSQDRVNRAISDKQKLEKAAMFMYGLSAQGFNDLVLMPQSRREVAQEDLEKRHISFDDWFGQAKKEAHVRLLFVPFTWDGERVQ